MLTSLHISGIALIDDLQVDFRSGFNVISGETGSGKSLILNGLLFLLGEKPIADLVRAGADRGVVEGVFDIRGNQSIIDSLIEVAIELESQELLIRRELGVNGRGKVFVNNQLCTLGLLKRFRHHLIDVHGQGDQQTLLDSATQLNVFDEFSGAITQRNIVEQAYNELLLLIKAVNALNQTEKNRSHTLEMIEFQIKEIEQAAILKSEDQDLEEERRILLNVEKLTALTSDAYANIIEDETSIIARLGQLQKNIKELAQLDPAFLSYVEQLEENKALLNDLAYFLDRYRNRVQVLPERLAYIDSRLYELTKLKRKYGGTIESTITTLTTLIHQQEELVNSKIHAQNLCEKLDSAILRYKVEARKLSGIRKAGTKDFEKKVKVEFESISTHPAQFVVKLPPPFFNDLLEVGSKIGREDPISRFHRHGSEIVEFHFSANPGEELRPLYEIVSGGELSRLMLAIKTILSPSVLSKVLIFDEVDSGVGGKIADAVGQRLKRLASNSQVLCVTHQVQLARYADAHFLVSKEVNGKRTSTKMRELNFQERVEELARMVGGEKVTDTARRHAIELLRDDKFRDTS